MTASTFEPAPASPSGATGIATESETEMGVALLHKLVRDAADEVLDDLARAGGNSLKAMMIAVGIDDFKHANLASLDLRGEDLSGISFAGADLSNADLRNCDLRGCDFEGAILAGANCDGARLSDAADFVFMTRAEIERSLAEMRRKVGTAEPRAAPTVAGAQFASGLLGLLARVLPGLRGNGPPPILATKIGKAAARPPPTPVKTSEAEEGARVESPTTTGL